MAEIMAKRMTFDNKEVLIWTDGDLTNGVHVIGRLISPWYINIQVAKLMMDEICLYSLSELQTLRNCARQAITKEESHTKRLSLMRDLMQRKSRSHCTTV